MVNLLFEFYLRCLFFFPNKTAFDLTEEELFMNNRGPTLHSFAFRVLKSPNGLTEYVFGN